MSDSAAPKTACECPARKQLRRNRQGYQNILEFRQLDGAMWGQRDGYGGRYGALTREELEGIIAENDAALAALCPCEALREELNAIINSLARALFPTSPIDSARAEFFLDAAGACKVIERMRAERDQLRAQVEEHQRWPAADSQHAENQRLRAELKEQLQGEVERLGSIAVTQVGRAETAEKITAEERIAFGATITSLRAELENAKFIKQKALELGGRMEEERDRILAKNEQLLKELVALRVRDSKRGEAIHRMLELADARDIDDSSAIRKLENECETLRAELDRRNGPEPHGPLLFDDPDGGER